MLKFFWKYDKIFSGEYYIQFRGMIYMNANLLFKKDEADPVKALIISYPRLAIIKAAFSLLKLGKDLNYSNMKQMLEKMMLFGDEDEKD